MSPWWCKIQKRAYQGLRECVVKAKEMKENKGKIGVAL